MFDLPGNRVARFAHHDSAQQIVNDMHQCGRGRFGAGQFLQALVFVLAPDVLNFSVERFLAGKVFVDKCFGNACGFGQLAGSRVAEALPGKKWQGCRYDGLAPLLRTQSLIKHASKLVPTHHLSTQVCRLVICPNSCNVWIKEVQECTLVTMKRFSMVCAMLALAVSVVQAQSALSATASAPRFKVLALAESGGHHVEFTKAA